ncbi:MAG: anaerobic ribonucleoside-triphosphate reductase activating protein [Clostridia bacterium]|nr:anaerobic ribonucleoside-triphosphate reductase activating protein [Clostridia bacterium]
MEIAGYIKTSFVDYPDKICTTVFTAGCNMNCWYCHNNQLLSGKHLNFYEEVMEHLNKRRGQIDAVTVSGGEPTLNKHLEEFIKEVKALGYLIKLDTNGLKPNILKNLLDHNLLDYVAMDIKAPFSKYEKITQVKIDENKIKASIELLKNSNIEYEFRTTFSPDLNLDDIKEIAKLAEGCKNFSLQAYKSVKNDVLGHNFSVFKEAINIISEYIPSVKLKGL